MSTPKSNVADPWSWFTPEEFAARRERVFEAIGTDTCGVVQGAGPVNGFEAFRQTNEFFYLCGLELPSCLLLLDGRSRRTTIFLPRRGDAKSSEGDQLGAEDAEILVGMTGVDEVLPTEALAARIAGAPTIATPHAPAESRCQARDTLSHAAKLVAADPWDKTPVREERFIALIRERSSMETRPSTLGHLSQKQRLCLSAN